MVNDSVDVGIFSRTAQRLGQWVRPTIGRKLGLFFVLFLAVTYGNLHYAVTLFDNLNSSAIIVNETGRLRYLSQRIAYLATRLAADDRRQLSAKVDAYTLTLAGIERHLQNEGHALLDQTPALAEKLRHLRAKWEPYAAATAVVAAAVSDEPDNRAALDYLHDNDNAMLNDADDIVNMLTVADRQVREQVHRQIDAAMVLEALFLLLVFIFIQRGVSSPVRQLVRLCQSFAGGEYSLRMNFTSCDEVGELARSFNRTADITSGLIHDLNLRTRQTTLLHRAGLALQEHADNNAAPDARVVAEQLVRLLPEGWQYAEIAAARIVCGNVTAQSADFRETPQCMTAERTSAAGAPIRATVCYREARPAADEGPFLAEEREMLDHVAGMLKAFVDGVDTRRIQERLLSILENTTDLVVSFQPNGDLFYLNAAAHRLFGVTPDDDAGNIAAYYPEWAHSMHQHAALPAALFDGCWTGELAVLNSAGTEIPVSQTLLAHRDAQGTVDFYSFIARDISEGKRVAAQLDRLTNQDTLTGLPNRNLLLDRIAQALALARRQDCMAAVMFLDLDRFKTVNDTLGHETGDRLLVVVSERLKACLREGDTVARIGGDEFVVVLPNIADNDLGRINNVAEKLLKSLASPIQIDEHELFVSASLGISLYPRDGEDAPTVLKHADVAMYRAKDEGRNNHQFFAADMNARALERLTLENRLRRALENDEFVVHYQPQVETSGGRIVGVEALVRWQSPTLGLISPADFIPLAEETGLIVSIGAWVLHAACAQNRAWQDAGLPPVRVAVNLSARQFQQRDVVKMVAEALAATNLDGRYLDLELTESMLMHDPEKVIETLRQLKALGIHIALDDFGTGYSSLAYLKRFPIDEIKIDQSFVRDVVEDPEDAAIVRAILGISRSLGLSVVAEGVETLEQQHYLQQHDCDRMQGYLFGRPVPAGEIAVLLAATVSNRGGDEQG